MPKWYHFCTNCFRKIFRQKPENTPQAIIEETQMQNNFNPSTNLNLNTTKIQDKKDPDSALKYNSSLKSKIITGKDIISENFGENKLISNDSYNSLKDISAIPHMSYDDSYHSINISTPKNNRRSQIIPEIFDTNHNGKMPRLCLANPKLKFPKIKSASIKL